MTEGHMKNPNPVTRGDQLAFIEDPDYALFDP
jgi:hypothetical protein